MAKLVANQRIRTLPPRVGCLDTRTARPAPKIADPHYGTPGHSAWRANVILAAGGRCQWIENGRRCEKSEPEHRMFADHIVEIIDGGGKLDPSNGMCLCGQHHTLKTNKARAKRTANPA